MKQFLSDPRLLQYLLLIIYFYQSCRWAVERSWGDCLYWFSAMLITTSVTFFRH
jgi:hypothetical protein